MNVQHCCTMLLSCKAFPWQHKKTQGGGHQRSAHAPLADFLTCQHMAARQTHSFKTRHWYQPGGTDPTGDPPAFSYGYVVDSKPVRYLSTPPAGPDSLTFPISSGFTRLPLVKFVFAFESENSRSSEEGKPFLRFRVI